MLEGVVHEAVPSVASSLELELGERLAGGEFGAFHARTRQGQLVVLKVLVRSPVFCSDRVSRAVEFAEALRAEGYPAPRYLDVGVVGEDVYTVQEFVQGSAPARLSRSLVSQLMELVDTHADQAADLGKGDPETGRTIVSTTVTKGRALLEKTTDPQVIELANHALEVCAQANPDIIRFGDIAHQDFHAENMLVSDGRVVAVIDWEGARAGDFRTDLVRLMATSLVGHHVDGDDAVYLRAEAEQRLPADVRALLGASWAVQDLDFALRRPEALPYALATSEEYLSNLS